MPGYAQYRSFSEDLSMNMEEIVALSVKHNVSDLHLCSAWPARWRIRGLMEAAPFEAP
ncbi:type IV pili twitching motility protein PilT, partial [Shigella sonnei]